jgi:hypothetical protein
MQRNKVLKVLNPILAILMLNQILTGFLNEWLPPKAFEILHEGGGGVLTVVAILHVILNWNWIRATFFKRAAHA